jgi:hypothetical protein
MTRTRRQFAQIGIAFMTGAIVAPRLALAQDDNLPPNVFISPAGQPFRAPQSAPYPVGAWFKQANKKGDGQLAHPEFVADAAAFFDTLDSHHVGVLDGFDIEVYERRIAPEILGYRIDVGALEPGFRRLWLAQYGGAGVGGPGGGVGTPGEPAGQYDHQSENPHPNKLDESGQGASPFSFFAAPEPVTEADTEFRGHVRKTDFLKLADRHFAALDDGGRGFLTLDRLPKTRVQIALERSRRRL